MGTGVKDTTASFSARVGDTAAWISAWVEGRTAGVSIEGQGHGCLGKCRGQGHGYRDEYYRARTRLLGLVPESAAQLPGSGTGAVPGTKPPCKARGHERSHKQM